MVDELPQSAETPGSALSTISDTVEGYVTGLPAPVRKGAIKAFGQLFSAAIEYPLAILQGSVEERRAETKARVRIIEEQAKRIAEQSNVSPDFVQVASEKFARKIIREQINLDKIVEISADQLGSENLSSNIVSEELISSDWLNAFESVAKNMSSEQMQALFGKILAGEISKPSSFSVKSINIVSQMDTKTASKFQVLVSCLTTVTASNDDKILDARVVGLGNAALNSLASFGLNFVDLNILQENGLIISDFNSNFNYGHAVVVDNSINFPLTFQNENYALFPKSSEIKSRPVFQVSGVGLTRAGLEIFKVIEPIYSEEYTNKLVEYFDNAGYVLTKI